MEPSPEFLPPGWRCPLCEPPGENLIDAYHVACYEDEFGPIPTTDEYEADHGATPAE